MHSMVRVIRLCNREILWGKMTIRSIFIKKKRKKISSINCKKILSEGFIMSLFKNKIFRIN